MKKTAVELLEEKLNKIKSSSTDMNGTIKFLETEFKELFKQSKEMEKQQVIDACNFGYYEGCAYMSDIKSKYESFEQYYDEKFNKEI